MLLMCDQKTIIWNFKRIIYNYGYRSIQKSFCAFPIAFTRLVLIKESQYPIETVYKIRHEVLISVGQTDSGLRLN